MRFTYFFAFIVILSFTQCNPTKTAKTNYCNTDSIRIAFYNVENLFDLEDNPNKLDEAFTPTGEKKWTQDRYDKKLDDVAKVISTLGFGESPPIMGLCEVENEAVLKDLLKKPAFRNGNFNILHKESPDRRGIDVCMLYDANKISINNWEAINIDFPFDKEYTSRDIVYAEAMLNNCEAVHLFVNHWPSRYGGQKESEPRRLQAAKTAKAKIDKIKSIDPNAKIILIGDFNDMPDNKSVNEVIGACLNLSDLEEGGFYNAIHHNKKYGFGSYNYRGNWNLLDQVIVSESLVNAEKGYHTKRGAKILNQRWMLYYDKKYKHYKPNKTYGGPNYYGGISDHLPVYIDVYVE